MTIANAADARRYAAIVGMRRSLLVIAAEGQERCAAISARYGHMIAATNHREAAGVLRAAASDLHRARIGA